MTNLNMKDMDLYDESRTLVHFGPLARRQRSDADWYGWADLMVALLDNYRECIQSYHPFTEKHNPFVVILMREETSPNGVVKRHVVSRVSQASCCNSCIFKVESASTP